MPQQVVCSRGLDRQKCDIRNVKGICKWAGHSQIRFGTLPLVEAKLSSQTLAMVEERMGFQMLSNKVTEVGGARICANYRCRVRFQSFLQAASIIFFWLLSIFYLGTLMQSKQLYNLLIFDIHTRWFRLFVPLPISVGWFDFFRRGATKGKGTYLITFPLPSPLNLSKPSSSSLPRIYNR